MYPNESLIYNLLKQAGQPLTTQQIIEGVLPATSSNMEALLQGMLVAGFIQQTTAPGGEPLWSVTT